MPMAKPAIERQTVVLLVPRRWHDEGGAVLISGELTTVALSIQVARQAFTHGNATLPNSDREIGI